MKKEADNQVYFQSRAAAVAFILSRCAENVLPGRMHIDGFLSESENWNVCLVYEPDSKRNARDLIRAFKLMARWFDEGYRSH